MRTAMEAVRTRQEVRAWIAAARARGERIAFVPTMGALHSGHLELLAVAKRHADRAVMSIFVNPLQFAPGEDLERYPRDLLRDLELAEGCGADLVFNPGLEEMYPRGEPAVTVVPELAADRLCGAFRPGHFRGVLTVVAKLFGIVRPDVAVFGQKDFQQLVLIRNMVDELEMGIEVVAAPIVRDKDGLALSSRNVYLSRAEREWALAIPRAIRRCRELFDLGVRDAGTYRRVMEDVAHGDLDVEYAAVVDPRSLQPVTEVEVGTLCAIAARVGRTRLIDNVVLGS